MARYAVDGSTAEPACDRCGAQLSSDHWARLSATHCGALANRYENADRRVCADCVAALGLLEFA